MKKTLRILQIANQAGPLYLFMGPLTDALRQAGAEVEYACMPAGPLWEALIRTEKNVIELPGGRWSNPLTWLRLYNRIRNILRSGGYDMIIVHTPAMSWVARFAARGLVPATVYFAHGLPFAPRQTKIIQLMYLCIERFMGKYTDSVIVMNAADAEACKKYRLTRQKDSWHKVPGVGVEIANAELNEKQRLTDKKMVLFLGRFIKSKRPGDILELARRMGPEVEFVLAGEGPLWDSIKNEASKIGGHVKVLGFTDQTADLIGQCSLLVSPSLFREGLPRVLLEAHAAGRPAVAYNVRGCSDVIVDGVTGYLAEPADVDGLYEAVKKIIQDDQLQANMGSAALERIKQEFTISKSVESIMSALQEVLLRKQIFDLSVKSRY